MSKNNGAMGIGVDLGALLKAAAEHSADMEFEKKSPDEQLQHMWDTLVNDVSTHGCDKDHTATYAALRAVLQDVFKLEIIPAVVREPLLNHFIKRALHADTDERDTEIGKLFSHERMTELISAVVITAHALGHKCPQSRDTAIALPGDERPRMHDPKRPGQYL